jgi:hypothetical protein
MTRAILVHPFIASRPFIVVPAASQQDHYMRNVVAGDVGGMTARFALQRRRDAQRCADDPWMRSRIQADEEAAVVSRDDARARRVPTSISLRAICKPNQLRAASIAPVARSLTGQHRPARTRDRSREAGR